VEGPVFSDCHPERSEVTPNAVEGPLLIRQLPHRVIPADPALAGEWRDLFSQGVIPTEAEWRDLLSLPAMKTFLTSNPVTRQNVATIGTGAVLPSP
jgi:hypothetical protein